MKDLSLDYKSLLSSNVFHSYARNLLKQQLNKLQYGSLRITDEWGVWEVGDKSNRVGAIHVNIEVSNARFYLDMLLAGSNGAAGAYRDGYWQCDNLKDAFRLLLKNAEQMDGLDNIGAAAIGNWWLKRRHKQRSNTRQGSRQNIHAHYDLGNDLFELFLDKTMTYSAGIFKDETTTLEQASIEKLDRICRKLDLKPSDHIIEIGTGWGSFSMHAATYYGCHVTTTTISEEQYKLAKQRIYAAGLHDRIELLLCDYRDLNGQFDKLVSIEMIEAVGQEFLPDYFNKCASLLKPNGQMCLQAITMPDQRYDRYLKTTDFIQQFIFPGCCVPSLNAIINATTQATDFSVFHIEDIGPSYATTLRHWLNNFMAQKQRVLDLGYDEAFIRLWEYYLCYCEAGFEERYTGDLQIVFNKPQCRANSILADV